MNKQVRNEGMNNKYRLEKLTTVKTDSGKETGKKYKCEKIF